MIKWNQLVFHGNKGYSSWFGHEDYQIGSQLPLEPRENEEVLAHPQHRLLQELTTIGNAQLVGTIPSELGNFGNVWRRSCWAIMNRSFGQYYSNRVGKPWKLTEAYIFLFCCFYRKQRFDYGVVPSFVASNSCNLCTLPNQSIDQSASMPLQSSFSC